MRSHTKIGQYQFSRLLDTNKQKDRQAKYIYFKIYKKGQ